MNINHSSYHCNALWWWFFLLQNYKYTKQQYKIHQNKYTWSGFNISLNWNTSLHWVEWRMFCKKVEGEGLVSVLGLEIWPNTAQFQVNDWAQWPMQGTGWAYTLCAFCSLHCTVWWGLSVMFSLKCAVYSMQCVTLNITVVFSMQCTVCSMQ